MKNLLQEKEAPTIILGTSLGKEFGELMKNGFHTNMPENLPGILDATKQRLARSLKQLEDTQRPKNIHGL
jgi:hypothetical protein